MKYSFLLTFKNCLKAVIEVIEFQLTDLGCTMLIHSCPLDSPILVSVRDSRVVNQEAFIETLAILVNIERHIRHKENTDLYIAFSFTESRGPVKVGPHEFEGTGILRLLTDFGDTTKKAISRMVYIVAERPQPQLYSKSLGPKSEETAKPSKGTKKKERSQSKGKEVQVKSEPDSKIKKEPLDTQRAGSKVRLYNTDSVVINTN